MRIPSGVSQNHASIGWYLYVVFERFVISTLMLRSISTPSSSYRILSNMNAMQLFPNITLDSAISLFIVNFPLMYKKLSHGNVYKSFNFIKRHGSVSGVKYIYQTIYIDWDTTIYLYASRKHLRFSDLNNDWTDQVINRLT